MISDAILIPKIYARLQEIASNFQNFLEEAPDLPPALPPSTATIFWLVQWGFWTGQTPLCVRHWCMRIIVVSVSTSRSRDGLETHQRLVSVSSRSREADVSVSAIYVSCPRRYFRPNYASHIKPIQCPKAFCAKDFNCSSKLCSKRKSLAERI